MSNHNACCANSYRSCNHLFDVDGYALGVVGAKDFVMKVGCGVIHVDDDKLLHVAIGNEQFCVVYHGLHAGDLFARGLSAGVALQHFL